VRGGSGTLIEMLVMNSPLTQAYGGVDNKVGGNGRKRTHAQGQFYIAVDNTSKRDYVHEIPNCPIICRATNPFVPSHFEIQFCAKQISRNYLRQEKTFIPRGQLLETACVRQDLWVAESLRWCRSSKQENLTKILYRISNSCSIFIRDPCVKCQSSRCVFSGSRVS